MWNPAEVRAHMRSVQRTQLACSTVDNRHVLIQIDRDNDIGLIDPDSLIGWRYLSRCRDIWPLTPLL